MRFARFALWVGVIGLAFLGAVTEARATTADHETAQGGGTVASLYFNASSYGHENVRLHILRDGRLLRTRFRKICRYCLVHPLSFSGHDAVHVRDLEGDGEPEVIVDLYTGGAHCCSYAEVFRYSGRRWRRARQFFGNAGYRFSDIDNDGAVEWLTADDRFAYRFACYACGGRPVRILVFRGSGWRVVTHHYSGVVAKDARHWLHLYRRLRHRHNIDGRGVLAPYIADLYTLGRRGRARVVLRHALRAGFLTPRVPYGPDAYPRGRNYIRALHRVLKRWGYT
jgi:hypothetical protein